MDTVYKTFKAEVRGVEEDGVVDLFIPVSSASVDRDGEIIEPAAFKKTLKAFMSHPVLVSSHQYGDLRKQIGEWTKLKLTDKGMDGKPKYYIGKGNDEADWGHFLATKGVAAFSVGFMPIKWEDGDGTKSPRRTYQEIELLEISQVIIPSNRDAIQSMRGKSPVVDELLDKALDFVTKPEETDNFIRIPVSDCEVTATIDISKDEGIEALYCGKEKKVRTYLFRKDKGWTMEKARKWVEDHSKSAPLPEGVSQTDTGTIVTESVIQDDFDEIRVYFEQGGQITKDTFTYAWKVVNGILKQAQGEIPDEIRKQFEIPQIDIVEAVRAAFSQITQEVK